MPKLTTNKVRPQASPLTNAPKGFEAVPLVAIIVAVAAFAGLVYLMVTAGGKKGTTPTPTTVPTTNQAVDYTVNTNAANINAVTNTNTAADVTKDWKTYTNRQNGFSFRYPKEWYIQSEQSNSWILESWDRATVVARGGLESGMIKADFSFSDATSTELKCSVAEEDTLVSCSDVVINGATYKRSVIDFIGEGGGRAVDLRTVRNGKLLTVIGYQAATDGLAKLDQIFSTFKFTK